MGETYRIQLGGEISPTAGLVAQIGTALDAPLIEVARWLVDAPGDDERGSPHALSRVVATILCAAAALEAATNWEAATRDPDWLPEREADPPDRKWASAVERFWGRSVDRGQGLGQRVAALINDRNLIAHYRGVRGADGRKSVFLDPDAKSGNISRVRSYFTIERARSHLNTAEEAIRMLRQG